MTPSEGVRRHVLCVKLLYGKPVVDGTCGFVCSYLGVCAVLCVACGVLCVVCRANNNDDNDMCYDECYIYIYIYIYTHAHVYT